MERGSRARRAARRLRQIEFGLGRTDPEAASARRTAAASERTPAPPRARATRRGLRRVRRPAPTRLDVFYGSAAFGETATSDDAARFSSPPACVVVFDDDVRAALGERACLVDPRDDRGEVAPEPSGTERSVRFLVLGEFGAVEVSAPGAEKAEKEKGEARVVARAAPGETWVPRCPRGARRVRPRSAAGSPRSSPRRRRNARRRRASLRPHGARRRPRDGRGDVLPRRARRGRRERRERRDG